MKTICAITVGRSDWGILRPVVQKIEDDPSLKLHLVAAAAHLLEDHGSTLELIASDGFDVHDQVEMLMAADSPNAVAKSMGLGTIGFADIYRRIRPDIVLLLGDRFEMHAAAVAAIPFKIPLAHIHGGEVSYGAIDDSFRHAITKYSHLHFASTQSHANRIMQLGEEPWRITVSGAPGLDNLQRVDLLERRQLEENLSIDLTKRPLVVCFHPVTLQQEKPAQQTSQIIDSLQEFDRPIVWSRPNADPGNLAIVRLVEDFCRNRPQATMVQNLGTQTYFSLMNEAAAMVGNSSSGIVEAASFSLPVVNIGMRQGGRQRSGNVIDVECRSDAISAGISKAISDDFRQKAAAVKNIYGEGKAGQKIVERLRNTPIDEKLLIKKFYDLPSFSSPPSQAA